MSLIKIAAALGTARWRGAGRVLHIVLVKRAGLDYWHLVQVSVHPDLDALFALHPEAAEDLWLATTKAPRPYSEARFSPDCWLFFGRETAGLPLAFRERHRDRCVRLPMVSGARSLNLANSAAILVYEALRQNGGDGVGSFASFLTMYKEKKNTNIYYTNQTILSRQFERS